MMDAGLHGLCLQVSLDIPLMLVEQPVRTHGFI